MMNCNDRERVEQKHYPSSGTGRKLSGILLIALGVIVILFTVPHWAWWGLIGAACIFAGILLLRSA